MGFHSISGGNRTLVCADGLPVPTRRLGLAQHLHFLEQPLAVDDQPSAGGLSTPWTHS
jgi:hypothetical protein